MLWYKEENKNTNKEKGENIGTRVIFWATPTHLGPTPRKETRKSVVYELARTYTQERPWQSAKIIANAADICNRSSQTNEFFCSAQEAYFLILAILQSNKREKKETLRFSQRFFAYMHLCKREIIHSYKKSRNFFTVFTFLDQLSCIKS